MFFTACIKYMASDDNDPYSNNLDRNDSERDLYAVLHISKDVRDSKSKFLSSKNQSVTVFRPIQQPFNKHTGG